MARQMISQREARRLKKELAAMKERDQELALGWLREWPSGTILLKQKTTDAVLHTIVKVARQLGRPIVVTDQEGDHLLYTAVQMTTKAKR